MALDPEADLAAGAAQPDASLGAFLERVALVADSDQIPDAPDRARCRRRHVDDACTRPKVWSSTPSS